MIEARRLHRILKYINQNSSLFITNYLLVDIGKLECYEEAIHIKDLSK